MRKKPVWGFDLDDVLCEFVPTHLEVANAYFGTNLHVDSLCHYYLNEELGIPWEDILPVLDIVWRPEKLLALPGILEGISALTESIRHGYKTYIITARDKKLESLTRQWLEMHGADFDEIVFTSNESKYPFIRDLNISHFVEDNPKNILELAKHDIQVFVPTYSWNRSILDVPNVTRLDSLSDLLCHF